MNLQHNSQQQTNRKNIRTRGTASSTTTTQQDRLESVVKTLVYGLIGIPAAYCGGFAGSVFGTASAIFFCRENIALREWWNLLLLTFQDGGGSLKGITSIKDLILSCAAVVIACAAIVVACAAVAVAARDPCPCSPP